MALWDSFTGGVGDFVGGMPFGGGGSLMTPSATMFTPNTSISTAYMQDSLSGTTGLGLGSSLPNFQQTSPMPATSAYTTPSISASGSTGGSLFGDTMDNLWGGLTNQQFTNLLNAGGKLWSISNQSQALEGMKQALEQQQQMAQDAYNRYVAEQEKRQQLNF